MDIFPNPSKSCSTSPLSGTVQARLCSYLQPGRGTGYPPTKKSARSFQLEATRTRFLGRYLGSMLSPETGSLQSSPAVDLSLGAQAPRVRVQLGCRSGRG
eukprot:2292520-Rhodomonas_salina.1